MKKQTLVFRLVSSPLVGLITKFGGQPTWRDKPQWPLSRTTGAPMRFVCQILLEPVLFGGLEGRMAYLFLADGESMRTDMTWDMDAGDNALILQPGEYTLPTQPLDTGPSLERVVFEAAQHRSQRIPAEYAVDAMLGDDPDSFSEDELARAWSENKLGGTPAFLNVVDMPEEGTWRLLLQLDSAHVPFHVYFGDRGIGYAFVHIDGTQGKFTWQCS